MSAIATAADLIRDGQCSAQCLCGTESSIDQCSCRCDGRYHGAIAHTEIEIIDTPLDRRPWWIQCHRGGWSESATRDRHLTVPVSCFYQRYREEIAKHDEFIGLKNHGRHGYEFEWDMHYPGSNPYLESEVLERFYALLEHRGRSGFGLVGDSYARTCFIKDRDEAFTIAALSGECISGNPTGTMRAIYTLSGWRDPVEYNIDPDQLPFPEVLPSMHARAWQRSMARHDKEHSR